jgi:putative ABC transport system ATP-binding protein
MNNPVHTELTSLYVEPESGTSEIEWPALECRDLFKIYRSGPVETVALRGLDMRVEKGEVVAVLGPSGCGKSTFLALAAGLDVASAGEVVSLGRSLTRLDETDLARYRSRDVAVVFQTDNLWPDLSAEENVRIALNLAGGARDSRERAADALQGFGVGDRAGQLAGSLSGGEQQRVAIAAAAAREAALVLADEPTGELDEQNEQLVLDALLSLRDRLQSTIVVVTHSERVALAADRLIEMRDGRAVS